jgi:hypothetical protein
MANRTLGLALIAVFSALFAGALAAIVVFP